jgi:DNA replication protein DnaC
MTFKNFSDYTPTPVTKYRAAQCDVHGAHQEMGGSLTGREDAIRWFGCSKCNKTVREQEDANARAAEEVKRQKRIEEKLSAAGIPAAFTGRSFDTFVIENAEMQRAHDVAKSFADEFWSKTAPEGRCLVFGGMTGTGKSHLALAVAQAVLRRGTAMYMDTSDLLRAVRGTWHKSAERSEESMMHLLSSIDLLVIDEVGVQRGTADEQMTLTDIINRRYRDMRPTILLTNLPGLELVELLGPRVMSRLSERATFVTFSWDDWRVKKARK